MVEFGVLLSQKLRTKVHFMIYHFHFRIEEKTALHFCKFMTKILEQIWSR